ncbi:M48 family metalloprotease [Actinoplanes awajinensis]|uniref:Peptidase M48 domain-containing protein n=1 Tax=Actinoplanes awajinensis subsp. mycoplanecinus TaxID=135947 RepID=A0A0X3UXP7_9ACTN|nr:hypothetical protein [Actinoplanes awajinensis]KUL36672.1 hypothetical protein ADL15_12605 [Actinoplanes awajinensis subsp. mycoplanecinus]
MSTGETCPRCAATTISKLSAKPWCPACEWNLDRYDPDQRAPELGWRWLDRRLFRAAFWLTERQYAELKAAPSIGRAATAARIVTVTVSVLLLAMVAALLVVGIRLLTYDVVNPINLIGALLIGMAAVLRPRLGRLSRYREEAQELGRSTAPALFAVIDRVAGAIGAPVPDLVLLSAEHNAFTATAVCAGAGCCAWARRCGACWTRRSGSPCSGTSWGTSCRLLDSSLLLDAIDTVVRREARAAQPAAVVVTEPEQARMDGELATHYERVRRELAVAA